MNVHVDRDLVVSLTRDLIRFESVNPPGNEQPVAEYLAEKMGAFGLEAEVQPFEPGRANLVARLKGKGAGHLVFTGHLDVVPPGGQEWQHGPFSGDLVDGRIYGRGSADMKGGVASIAASMIALKQAGFEPAADIVLAATGGEEAGMTGAIAMVEQRALEGSRWIVVAEPSDLQVFIGEKGVLWVKVRALGRTAHGSMPWLGTNAVSYMARLIPQLEAYPFRFQESPLLGKPTLSVNIIGGGNKTNVVPDVCEITLDMRTVPSQDHQEMLRVLQETAERAAQEFDPNLRIELELESDVGSLETERDDPLVASMIESIRTVRGAEPEVGGVTYGTDAAHLGPAFSMPMVICGPGAPGMAHQPDENIEVEQLVQAAEIYADLAVRLLG